uniref:Uncharacterized protein n=1 Tax=Glossina austeni TaxID=7395 RepID=A0A1A9UZB3_GLOAU
MTAHSRLKFERNPPSKTAIINENPQPTFHLMLNSTFKPNMCTEQSTNGFNRPSAMPIISPNINREGKQIVTRSRRKSLIVCRFFDELSGVLEATDFNCAERTVSESPGR